MQSFENKLGGSLQKLLREQGELDERLPETPDIEDRWQPIVQSYLPDGVREFKEYPKVSLGWMMYMGMAMAKYWDDDWALYSKVDDLYLFTRDKSGFDLMDEYVRGPLLGLKQADFDATEQLVLSCAELSLSLLGRENYEPGTEAAFRGYLACLHQLYLMGAAVQLRRMGYKMVKGC